MRAMKRKNVDIRETPMMLRHGGVHIAGGKRRVDTDPQSAIFATAAELQPLDCGITVGNDSLRRIQKLKTRISEAGSPLAPHEQFRLSAVFPVVHALAQRCLPDVQCLCSLSQAAMLRDGDEPSEIAKLDHRADPSTRAQSATWGATFDYDCLDFV